MSDLDDGIPQPARDAARRMVERLLVDAQRLHGDDHRAIATAVVASFPRVWREYHGYNRRLMFAAAWEPDPACGEEENHG